MTVKLDTTDAAPTLADLSDLPLTMTVPAVAKALGVSPFSLYQLIKTNQSPVPVLRLGRRIVIPTVGVLRALGLDPKPVCAGDES